ncbi:hypothetical protein F8E02_03430 [Methanoculleus sp. Wushi-C6]|uniref:Uncharacterized protein n=1 Tax=Methanoculleus caldifontis TaxID=2651577 RepID=A0ABU3WZ50_9EURY|nr:hypothetical protein [Methanoculleus sp. Wushi-C6]MDV2481075.1 hypothetical protein [Methanoculleus sp. Wushi-C6]
MIKTENRAGKGGENEGREKGEMREIQGEVGENAGTEAQNMDGTEVGERMWRGIRRWGAGECKRIGGRTGG